MSENTPPVVATLTEDQVSYLIETATRMNALLDVAEKLIPVAEETLAKIGPQLDNIMSSPALRMLGVRTPAPEGDGGGGSLLRMFGPRG